MKTKRLFIGNIPSETQSSNLENEFSKFGTVVLVEIKSKANFLSPDILNYFAFITLDIEDNSLEKCIRHFEHNQFCGNFLTVSVARESFLDRLKREREENQSKESIKLKNHEVKCFQDEIVNKRATKTVFPDVIEPEEIQENHNQTKDVENYVKEEDSLVKKSASRSVRDGKIMIEKFTHNSRIEVPNVDEAHINPMNEKGRLANQRRLESLNQKQNQYSNKKIIIQKALVSENIKLPNKIVFDETEPDFDNKTNSKNNLFEDDSDDPENDNTFKLQNVFEGVQGEKLLQMQSRFQLDTRFRMNDKFSEEISEKTDGKYTSDVPIEIGSSKSGNFSKKLSMVRFDPNKPKKGQLVIQEAETPKDILTGFGANKNEEYKEVSKGQFYEIQNDFKDSFNQLPESGFSLLSLFNKIDKSEGNENIVRQTPKEKILLHKNTYELKNMDLSEDEIDEQPINKNIKSTINKNDSVETFFIVHSDQRLKDGMDFFKAVEKPNEQENYSETRNKLRIIINKKISKIKSKKNQNKFHQKVYNSKRIKKNL